MPDNGDGLPPLGQPDPAVRGRRQAWYRSGLVVASLGAAAGLVAGVLLGVTVAGRNGGEVEGAAAGAPTTAARPTTTRPAVTTLPVPCAETLRSAEQALQLLEQGLQSIRQFQIGQVEAQVSEMQRLRQGFSDRVRQCLERVGG